MAAQATHKESRLEPEEEEPPDILDLELDYTPEEFLGTMEPEYTPEREPLAIREREYSSEESQDTLEPKHTSEPQDRLELECTTEESQDRMEPECTTEESQNALELEHTLEPEPQAILELEYILEAPLDTLDLDHIRDMEQECTWEPEDVELRDSGQVEL